MKRKKQKQITYEQMVDRLAKPGDQILRSLNPLDCHLVHMAIGMVGEASEILDTIKKMAIYRKKIDRENLIEELGDLDFYMTGMARAIGVTRRQWRKANVNKLAIRYRNLSYSDQKAQERADKK